MGRRIADEFMDETRRPRREWSIQKWEGAMGQEVGQSGDWKEDLKNEMEQCNRKVWHSKE